jgi:predicted metal-dependent hydrolase
MNINFEGICVEVIRRKVRHTRIEFKPSGMVVIAPRGVEPLKVLEDNKKIVLKKYLKMKQQVEASEKIQLVSRTTEDFRRVVSLYTDHYCQKLNVKQEIIKFRKMKRRWGSCRSNGIITLNSMLQFVPERLIAYIVYHELTHLIIRNHDKRFKNMIKKEFTHHSELEKELTLYGLRLLA